jgi:hypothetical protein
MTIETYKTLIQSLPVGQQSFRTKRSNWKATEDAIEWLPELNNRLFQGKSELEQSRQDILSEACPIRELIIKTIYWGYPQGMRGHHFKNILDAIQPLEVALEDIKKTENPGKKEFESLSDCYLKVTGLGMSTFSKILYFMDVRFNGNPSLILDQRLIDVFKSLNFSEFNGLRSIRYDNTNRHYLDYLDTMNDLATKLETEGENLEQFLFIFGKNLKPHLLN